MSDKRIERRVHAGIELRDGDGGEQPTIEGYAAVFDSPSEDLGGFTEVVLPGAFDRALSEGADVRALVDHDASRILGRSKSGTLSMAVDDTGLRVRITPPDTTAGRDVVESLRRGDLDGMSFGFVTREDEWRTVDGAARRDLIDVDLFDVSVVAFPAYPDTTVAVRSLGRWRAGPPSPDPTAFDRLLAVRSRRLRACGV